MSRCSFAIFSDPDYSFLIIRYLRNHIHPDSSERNTYSRMIQAVVDSLDEDEIFALEKSLEWEEFDELLFDVKMNDMHPYGTELLNITFRFV